MLGQVFMKKILKLDYSRIFQNLKNYRSTCSHAFVLQKYIAGDMLAA